MNLVRKNSLSLKFEKFTPYQVAMILEKKFGGVRGECLVTLFINAFIKN